MFNNLTAAFCSGVTDAASVPKIMKFSRSSSVFTSVPAGLCNVAGSGCLTGQSYLVCLVSVSPSACLTSPGAPMPVDRDVQSGIRQDPGRGLLPATWLGPVPLSGCCVSVLVEGGMAWLVRGPCLPGLELL